MTLAYKGLTNYNEAEKYIISSLKIARETNNKNDISLAKITLGLIYTATGRHKEAKQCFKDGLNLAKELGNAYNISYSCLGISKIDSLSGDWEDAYKNFIIYNKYSDSVISKDNVKILVQKQLEYDFNKKTDSTRAENLKKELETQFLSKKKQDSIKFENDKIELELQNAFSKQQDSIRFENDKKQQALHKEMQLKSLKYEYEKKQALAKTEEEKQQLKYDEKLKQQKIEYEFAKKQSETEAIHKRKEEMIKAEQDKKDALALKELQQQKIVRNGFIGGFAIVFLFALLFFGQRNKIRAGKKKSDELLLNILPAEVAEELKDTGSATAKQFDSVTVLFTDFVGFTKISERLAPQQLVNELDACFKAFDAIMTKYGIEKIKTIGDAYLAVAGLPIADPQHAEKIVKAAIEINNFMSDRYLLLGEETFKVRIGIHSGSVVAGIVGVKKFAYDIWGDTVNTAARMEQNSDAGKINISQTTYDLVKNKFACTYRGAIQAKNKGEMSMYFVEA